MARAETEQLVVQLEARIRDFERNMQRANRTANRQFGQVERRAQQNATRLQQTMGRATAGISGQFAAMGRSMAGAFGVGLGAAGITMMARSALQTADAIGKMADRAGTGVEAFQRLAFAADLAGVSKEQLTTSLGMLNRRMAEGVVQGADTEDALLRIADRVQNATTAAERARIANEAFGRSGQQLLPFLQQGRDGIEALTREAERLGLVLDEKTIRQAEALNDELSRMMAVARTNIQGGILSGLVRDSEGLRSAYSDPQFQQGLRAFGQFIGESLGFLVRNADTIIRVMRALAAVYIGAKVGSAIGGRRGAMIGGAVGAGAAGLAELLRESADEVEEAVGRLDRSLSSLGDLGDLGGGTTGADPLAPLRNATRDARFELELLQSDLDDFSKDIARSLKGFGIIDSLDDLTPTAEVEEYALAVRRLRNEQEAQAAGEADQARAADIWRATRTEAEQYEETLRELIRLRQQGHLDEETYARAVQQAQEGLKSATEETSEAIEGFGRIASSAFEDAVIGGNKLREVVQGLAEDIARLMLRQAVTQPLTAAITGWLGGLFAAQGAAFSRGDVVPMARGGTGSGGILKRPTAFPMRSGGLAIGGELADEAILPLRRLPSGELGVGAAGGGKPVVNFAPVVQINVDRPSVQSEEDSARLAQTLAKHVDSALDAKVHQFVRRQMKPGGMLNL